ncbi:MAG: hypothetical protein GTO67_15560 [Gammaproteobacteria bacterium]|nr:hypothetical protein [Gammaproteobacteria bacterium]NIM73560.1 hypothetical protein [Gammaproteobacteria bacterium]NIN39969.1 hypothetical protein [Gammaproteobacteria bacterium]NIO25369.1 hypothetical protein [Gammaproteobacteria bacterium]NIO65996.1 hypothetical protein [Gammaproteobacteria bacterium]
MLYEEQLSLAPTLCLQCGTFFVSGESGQDPCPDCGEELSERTYEEWFRHAFYAVRFGYQYRSHSEPGSQSGDEGRLKPFLPPLTEVFTFMGMAAIGFINGGADRELSRNAIHKILGNWNVMSGEQERLTLSDHDVDAFIDCIEGYYTDVAGIKQEFTRGRGKAAGGGKRALDVRRAASRPDRLPSRLELWSKLGPA